MRKMAAVLIGTAAFFGILATPAQASPAPAVDQTLAIVGHVWGSLMPASTTESAANAALATIRR